jgi:hypothetical protein
VTIVDVTNIVGASWRAYPAAALAVTGLVRIGKGLWFGFDGSRGLLRDRDALGWMRGFRLPVVGLCLAGIAVAWVGQVLWLFVAAAAIMGEELLETSVIIETLKRHPPRMASRRSGEDRALRREVPCHFDQSTLSPMADACSMSGRPT